MSQKASELTRSARNVTRNASKGKNIDTFLQEYTRSAEYVKIANTFTLALEVFEEYVMNFLTGKLSNQGCVNFMGHLSLDAES